MTKSKREQEREWTVRKQEQHPHGKVKSLEGYCKRKEIDLNFKNGRKKTNFLGF